jgi:hypothetical protein
VCLPELQTRHAAPPFLSLTPALRRPPALIAEPDRVGMLRSWSGSTRLGGTLRNLDKIVSPP